MERAYNVFFGTVLIVEFWSWMIVTVEAVTLHGWGWFFLAGKIITACCITGPIYREYLR